MVFEISTVSIENKGGKMGGAGNWSKWDITCVDPISNWVEIL